MRRPHVRIFDLMGLIALAAINCLPYRMLELLGNQGLPIGLTVTAIGLTPMASLLVIVLVIMLRGIRGKGDAGPFLSGFLIFGLASMVGAAILLGSEELLTCIGYIREIIRDPGPPVQHSQIEIFLWKYSP